VLASYVTLVMYISCFSGPTYNPYSFITGVDKLNLSLGLEKMLERRFARVADTSVLSGAEGGKKSRKVEAVWPDLMLRPDRTVCIEADLTESDLVVWGGVAGPRSGRTELMEEVWLDLTVRIEAGSTESDLVVWGGMICSRPGRTERIEAGLSVLVLVV